MRRIAEQNQMSLDQFRLPEQDGLSHNDMRRQVEQEIMIGVQQDDELAGEISTNEIDDFLATEAGQELTADEFRVGHILILFKGAPAAIRSICEG